MTRRILTAREQHQMLSPWRVAMPAHDAYDDHIPHFLRKRETQPSQGDFFHGTDLDFQPGDILESARSRGDVDRIDYMENQVGSPSQANWVWMHKDPHQVRSYGKNVYQVEPLDEGPWPWGGPRVDSWDGRVLDDQSDGPDDEPMRYVSPRARVIRKAADERAKDFSWVSPWRVASAAQDEAEAAGTRRLPLPVRRQRLYDEHWMKKPWAESETLLRPHGKNVTMYHRTSPEEADRLVERGFEHRDEDPDTKDVYFSDINSDVGAAESFGDAVVKVTLPHKAIGPKDSAPQTVRHRRLDDPEDTEWHHTGPAENWYAIDSKNLPGVPVTRISSQHTAERARDFNWEYDFNENDWALMVPCPDGTHRKVITDRDPTDRTRGYRNAARADGLEMRHFPDQESVDAAYGPGGEVEAPAVAAHYPGDPDPAGYLQWHPADDPERPNMISWVDVWPDFRRKGVGSALWEHAKGINPDLQHSPQRTIDGDEWAHAVGGEIPPLMDDYEDEWED